MILLENDFLKTYNEIDSLWEDTNNLESNTAELDSFDNIAKNAIAFADKLKDKQSLTDDELNYWLNYWCRVREILLSKKARKGDYDSKTWYNKFITFYKAYKAECLIAKWLRDNGGTYGISNVDFCDKDRHHKLYDGGDSLPDLIARINGHACEIECKTVSADSSIHGADLVARHTEVPINGGTLRFCLVGQKEDSRLRVLKRLDDNGKEIKARRPRLGINTLRNYNKDIVDPSINAADKPKFVHVISDKLSLDTGFEKLPVKGVPAGKIEDLSPVLASLKSIDEYLSKNELALRRSLSTFTKAQITHIDDTTEELVDSVIGLANSQDVTTQQKLADIKDAVQTGSETLERAAAQLNQTAAIVTHIVGN